MFVNYFKQDITKVPACVNKHNYKQPSTRPISSDPVNDYIEQCGSLDENQIPFITFLPEDDDGTDYRIIDAIKNNVLNNVLNTVSIHAYVGAVTLVGTYIVYKFMKRAK